MTLRLWLDPAGPDSDRACCSPSAVIAARETCHGLGLPHVTLDLREQFRRAVVTPFVRGYARGETPNPCIRCNGGFRFAELLAFRRRVGAARLSTGHYARIVEHGGRLLLARAADPLKDQSYMLARLDPRHLRRIWFPLGEQAKSETRAEAARAGLAVAQRAESQEACFLAGDDYRSFLERQGLPRTAGAIVDEDGGRARHARRLLAVHARPAPRPRRLAPRRRSTHSAPIRARTPSSPARGRRSRARASRRGGGSTARRPGVTAKLRYRSPAVRRRGRDDGSGFPARLDEPAYGVARGQAAVLYDGDVVVGSGLVTSARG